MARAVYAVETHALTPSVQFQIASVFLRVLCASALGVAPRPYLSPPPPRAPAGQRDNWSVPAVRRQRGGSRARAPRAHSP